MEPYMRHSRTDAPANEPTDGQGKVAKFWRNTLGLLRGYQHHAILLLILIYSVDFADRTLIGAIGPTLKNVFNIGNFELGLLASAFALVSAPAAIPFGILTDRMRRTWLLGGATLVWVVAEVLVGFSTSFLMLLLVRIGLGIVGAVTGPTSPSLIGDLVPADERSRALSVIDGGELVGDAFGFILPAIILGFVSWRWNFWILAAVGLILSFAFLRLPEPARTGAAGPTSNHPETQEEQEQERQHGQRRGTTDEKQPSPLTQSQRIVKERRIQPTQSSMVRQNPEKASYWYAVKYTFRVKTDLLVLLSRTVGDFLLTAIGTFAVVFATKWYSLSERQAEVLILVIGVGALVGILALGRVSDLLLDRGILRSRILIGALGYLIAPIPLYFAFTTHSLFLAAILFFVGAFIVGGALPPLDAVRIDVLVPYLRGRAESVRQFTRTLAEAGAPLLLGLFSGILASNSTQGLQRSFLLLLPLLLLAGLVLVVATFTYEGDVAAALASNQGIEQEDQRNPPDDNGDRGPQQHRRDDHEHPQAPAPTEAGSH